MDGMEGGTNSVPPPGGPEGVPPPPGPQSGGQSARAIAMTIGEPEVGSGAVMGTAMAAATTATTVAALAVRRSRRSIDVFAALPVLSVVFMLVPV
ncbi:hypothetical protein [Mycobacteroides abscessus]|uniref:hypothetical protein n=1 Tax=Mycobacteroides abscessus TaxID=36809 RepID=UPI0009A55F7B|nr:hypothetical protein [Mycobacteroides abscessus]